MSLNEFYKEYADLVSEIHNAYGDEDGIEHRFDPLFKKAGIIKVIITSNALPNPIFSAGRTINQVIYDSGEETNEEFSETKESDTISGGKAFEQIFWSAEADSNPDFTVMKDRLSDLVFLFYSRRNMSEDLNHVISKDLLTGTYRMDTIARLYGMNIQAKGLADEYAIIFTNIQNMKYYNNRFGKDTGDRIIALYGGLLKSMCHDDEYLARPGGDNFVFAVRTENVQRITEALQNVTIMGLPGMDDKPIHLSAWCGVADSSDPDKSFDRKAYQASVAMQIAKSQMHQRVMYFSKEIDTRLTWGNHITNNFDSNLKKGCFIPFYQPKVFAPTGQIIGLEALVRLNEGNGLISPARFIPILEDHDMITSLDLYMLRKVCDDINTWIDSGIHAPIVSINLSRRALYSDTIIDDINNIITETQVPRQNLEIEITETTTLKEMSKLVLLTKQLKSMGLLVSIDDFGTGYSSLSMLMQVSADIIKIDKSFIDACFTDNKSVVLIKNMIHLASELGLKTIAEGVETRAQAEFLAKMGCLNIQGYLYSKPVPFESVRAIIKSGRLEPKENNI